MAEEKNLNLKQLHSTLEKAIYVFEHHFKPAISGRLKPKELHVDAVFNLILAKSMKTARAIHILAEKGYGEDGFCLARSLFENMIHLSYISKEETSHRCMLFLRHGKLEFFKRIEGLPKNQVSNAAEIQGLEKEFDDEFFRIKQRFPELPGKKPSWSTLSLKQMSKFVGEFRQYEKLYGFMSWYSHPHAEGLRGYVGEGEFSDLPGNSMIEETLVFCLSFIIQIFVLFDKQYGLGLDPYISELNLKHNSIVRGS